MLVKTLCRPLSSLPGGGGIRVGLLAFSCLVALALALAASDASAAQLPVPLGAASSFAAGGGTTGFCALTSQTLTRSAGRRPPAGPLLLSPVLEDASGRALSGSAGARRRARQATL